LAPPWHFGWALAFVSGRDVAEQVAANRPSAVACLVPIAAVSQARCDEYASARFCSLPLRGMVARGRLARQIHENRSKRAHRSRTLRGLPKLVVASVDSGVWRSVPARMGRFVELSRTPCAAYRDSARLILTQTRWGSGELVRLQEQGIERRVACCDWWEGNAAFGGGRIGVRRTIVPTSARCRTGSLRSAGRRGQAPTQKFS
jgi:hypothetical protein